MKDQGIRDFLLHCSWISSTQSDGNSDVSFTCTVPSAIHRLSWSGMSRCCASDDSSILSPLSQRSWPLLVARSQGNNVVDLLRNELVANSFMAWTETPNTRTHSYLVVPAVVACQLKYDPSRAMIITYLYGKNAIHSQLFDVTAVFRQAALVVAHEAFFTDAAPSQNGSCPRCSICLPR